MLYSVTHRRPCIFGFTIQLLLHTMPHTLFTPGPTPIPDRVLKVLSQPIIHHRSEEAKSIVRVIRPQLRRVVDTTQEVIILSSSGTGAVEAAMASLGRVGQKVLVLNNGKFARRWVDMAARFGMHAIDVSIPWSEPATVDHLLPALSEHPDCAMVWMVHSETSTGTASDIRALSAAVREHSNALVCVDAISSLCALELHMDEWDIDVVTSGSQKGFMLPPGLAFVCLSERAWKVSDHANVPSYYFDLKKARIAAEENTTPWTPAISLICGLQVSLEMILNEGMPALWKRHADLALDLRTRLRAMGLSLYSKAPSNSVTAVQLPAHRPSLVKDLLITHGIRVAGGQDHLKAEIFRIGHLGDYHAEDIEFLCASIAELL